MAAGSRFPRRSHGLAPRRVSDLLGAPKDVALGLPCLSLEGNLLLRIENHEGVVELNSQRVRVHTPAGQVSISGRALKVSMISQDVIIVEGWIGGIEFVGWGVS
ncbi:MAG: YabP/YqfC family sporulation protein [Clostridia bacterium]|nr:YabP/YqfC family sporulation protein [Clostridia bacterium]